MMNGHINAVIFAILSTLTTGCIDLRVFEDCPEGMSLQQIQVPGPEGELVWEEQCQLIPGALTGDSGVVADAGPVNCTGEESLQSPSITRLDESGDTLTCFESLVDDGSGVCIPETDASGDTVYDCTDSCTSESVIGLCDGFATLDTGCNRFSGMHILCGEEPGDCGPFPSENPCPHYANLHATCTNGIWEHTCEPTANFAVCDQEGLSFCETNWVEASPGQWCLRIGEMGTQIEDLPQSDIYCTNDPTAPQINSCAFDPYTGCSCISLEDGPITTTDLANCP